ncbi:hypothetical protein Dsin_009048 [Dipteronia sinensis]|uniref:MULE transposase domain-containing protein n=1 Tax=Dipteronia sinensis TaxID=43782 RepID=A0AAE0EB91_9ROSI|nr:hypothetical protein Dsin_009048 [Dipteronia sinensis]
MPGTSEVRHNVSADDSDNATAWVIPGADSYSFGTARTSTLVSEETRIMIYKGQFFPTKKDLKRLVGLFEMRQNFEWKVKRSNKTTLHLVCLIDNCMWKLRAVLEQQNPGTITDLQCADDGKFMYFFMSLGALLRGFRRCMRPIIAVDGTHLKGRFGGTMFVATTQDRNEHVYQIAFGYSDSENNLSWEWFLDCLKGALGYIDDLVFISDRHASIEAGISKVFPYATHTICCWHFAENVKKRFHRKDVASIMDKTARAYTELKYNRYMCELRNLHKMYSIMLKLPVHTNGPVYTVPNEEFIRNMLQRWFHDRHRAAQSMRHQLTDATYLVILERVTKCSYMTVNPVD